MTRQRGGDKRSSWETFRRRLLLVRRLLRGPAPAETLIAAVRQAAPDAAEIYPADARAALRHDLAALRHEFQCQIRSHPKAGYTLEHLGSLTLLDLPDEELEALVFLEALIADSSLPNAATIGALLARVTALLPDERQQTLGRLREHPRVAAPDITYDPPATILATLKRVLGRQQIIFDYRSSYATDDTVIQHRVAPYDLVYRDGHTYLEAYCHACAIEELVGTYVTYRLNRIVEGSLTVLSQVLPPSAPSRPTYTIRYLLAPVVARQRDISLWFDACQVTFQGDGSALVTAQTSDLWQARQVVLRYREHCRVLEPPQLVTMVRESIERMAQHYAEEPRMLHRDDTLSTEERML
jgi:predicted DNA-binding transcriptional regulator YafY